MADAIPDNVLELMAVKFRLLGDSTRLAILRSLVKGGEKSVGQLVAETGRSQTNVSKHLKQMSRAGMLARRKEGLHVFYQLVDLVVEKICRLVCDSIVEDVTREIRDHGPPHENRRP